MSDMLAQALLYEKRGLSVIPLNPRDKRPNGTLLPLNAMGRSTWQPFQKQRANDDQILEWWGECADCNIGIITGSISGVIVLDIDSEEGEREVEQRGGLPATPVCLTGKGRHIYLLHPGRDIHNFAKKIPGVDLRGDGGYVVAPPSIHPSGAAYRWETDPVETTFAPIPAWLLDLLTAHQQPKAEPRPTLRTSTGDDDKARQAFDEVIDYLSAAAEGQRNDALNKAALRLGHYVGAGRLNRYEVESALASTARSIGLMDGEIGSTIRSGIEKGISDPTYRSSKPIEIHLAVPSIVVPDPKPEADDDLISMAVVAKAAKATAIEWARDPQVIRGYTTKIEELDETTGGFLQQDLLMLLGRTGAGKSTLAMQFAIEFAKQAEVLIFTTEMAPEWYTHRIASYMQGINAKEIYAGNAGQNKSFLAHYDTAATWPITFYKYDSPDPTILRRKAEQFKARGGKIMIVDSLQNVSKAGMATYPGTVAICDALRYCVRDVGLFVMATCQANRGPADRADKEPLISDAEGGGAIEQNATRFITVYRPGYDIETRQTKPKQGEDAIDPNVAYLTIVKDRWFGAQGKRIATYWAPGKGFQKVKPVSINLNGY